MNEYLLVVCKYNGNSLDLLIPQDIFVDQLITVLQKKLSLSNHSQSYIRSENPIRLLAGSIPVSSFGLHDGSILYL